MSSVTTDTIAFDSQRHDEMASSGVRSWLSFGSLSRRKTQQSESSSRAPLLSPMLICGSRRMIQGFSRRQWITAAGLFLTTALFASLRITPRVCGGYHDDGIYVASAQSIAEGHGYRLIDLPGSPPQTKYPFLYPAILALMWRLSPEFPANIAVFQAFSVFCASASVAVSFLYLSRFGFFSEGEAALGCALCGSSSVFLYFATQALSEPLFGLLVIGPLWMLERRHVMASAAGKRESFILGLALGAPVLCRLVAAPITAAGICISLRRRNAPLVIAGVCLAILPWLLWLATHSTGRPTSSFENYYSMRNYTDWWVHGWHIPVVNFFGQMMAASTFPVPSLWQLKNPLWPILGGLAVLASLIRVTKTRVPLAVCVGSYLFVTLFWAWPPLRFVFPIAPILSALLVHTVNHAMLRLPSVIRRRTLFAVVAIVVVSNLTLFVQHLSIIRRTGFANNVNAPAPANWPEYEKTFEWIRSNTDRNAVLASGLDTMLYLYTRRKAFRPFGLQPENLFYGGVGPGIGTARDFVRYLRDGGAQFAVQLPMPGFVEERQVYDVFTGTLQEFPQCLREKYRNPDDVRFIVYAVDLESCGR